MTRVLGFAPLAALTAALVYQLSPYILPYISRTSVLLLPYAGLGWIVGLTVMASLSGSVAISGSDRARGADGRGGQRDGIGDGGPRTGAVAHPCGLGRHDHLASSRNDRCQDQAFSVSACRSGGS